MAEAEREGEGEGEGVREGAADRDTVKGAVVGIAERDTEGDAEEERVGEGEGDAEREGIDTLARALADAERDERGEEEPLGEGTEDFEVCGDEEEERDGNPLIDAEVVGVPVRVPAALVVPDPLALAVPLELGVNVAEGVTVATALAVTLAVELGEPVALPVTVAEGDSVFVACAEIEGVKGAEGDTDGVKRRPVALTGAEALAHTEKGAVAHAVPVAEPVPAHLGLPLPVTLSDDVSDIVIVGDTVPRQLPLGEAVEQKEEDTVPHPLCDRDGDPVSDLLTVPVPLREGEAVAVVHQLTGAVAVLVRAEEGEEDAQPLVLGVAVPRGVPLTEAVGEKENAGERDAEGLGVEETLREKVGVAEREAEGQPVDVAQELVEGEVLGEREGEGLEVPLCEARALLL